MYFKTKYLVLFLVGILIFSNCFSQTDYDYINKISVTGNINVTGDLIKSTSQLRVGDIYEKAEINKAIKNIYNLGLFKDITISKNKYEDGVEVVISVDEYAVIENFEVTGNQEIKQKKILSEVKLSKGEYLTGKLKFKMKNAILDLYYEKGFRLATVNFEVEELPNNKVDLTIAIIEGSEVRIKKIIFKGNKNISSKKLLGEMKTKPKGFFRSGKFELEKFEEDLIRIEEFYKSEGYINAKVEDWDKEYNKSSKLILVIDVFEGNQYKLAHIKVKGNTRFKGEQITSQLDLQKGDVFNEEEFNKKLANVRSMYFEDGFIYSSINRQLETNKDSLDITLNINENNRAKVRKIFINGNKKTEEKIIRRKLAVFPGDYFRQSLIMQTQRNIYNMGFFEPNIGIDYQPINADGDIDLIFNVKDKVSGNANFGVNYDAVNGFVGFIKLAHNNLFGQAKKVELTWEFSGSKQNYDISYTDPYVFNSNILAGVDIFHTQNEWTDWNYEVHRTGGGLRAGSKVPWLNFTRFTTGFSYTEKYYEFINEDGTILDQVQDLVDEGKKISNSMYLSLERDNRNNIFRPSQGSYTKFYTEIAGSILGGNEEYLKQTFQTNWHFPLFWEFSFGMKVRMGNILPLGSKDVVPLDEKFYPGGIGPDGIRGYPDRSIEPEDTEGANAEFITSYSITVPLSGDKIIGLAFLDAGNSYRDFSAINLQYLKKGAGVGVRVQTPMGLIGFDYAYGFDRDVNNKWEFHFQFGSTF